MPSTISGSFSLIIITYHLIVVGNIPAWFGLFIPSQIHSAISLTCAGLIIFLTDKTLKGGEQSAETDESKSGWKILSVSPVDYLLISFFLASCGYVIFFNANLDLYAMYGFLDTKGIVLGSLLGIAILEAVRRTAGITLVIVILFFVLITVFQQYLPGILFGAGASMDRLLSAAYAG